MSAGRHWLVYIEENFALLHLAGDVGLQQPAGQHTYNKQKNHNKRNVVVSNGLVDAWGECKVQLQTLPLSLCFIFKKFLPNALLYF